MGSIPSLPASHLGARLGRDPSRWGNSHRPTGWVGAGRGGVWRALSRRPTCRRSPLSCAAPDAVSSRASHAALPRPGSFSSLAQACARFGRDHCRSLSVGIVLALRPGGSVTAPRLLSPSWALPTTTRAKSARKSGAAERRLFDGLHPRFSSKKSVSPLQASSRPSPDM